MATLALPSSPRILIYRAIERTLKTNPVLKRTVKEWRTWTEKPGQSAAFNINVAPAIRLTPSNGPAEWLYPEAMVNTVFIDVEMQLATPDVDDVFNLWYAIEKALYPGGPATLANIAAFQAIGAKTGYAMFSMPAFDPAPDGSMQTAFGQIKIEVRIDFNV